MTTPPQKPQDQRWAMRWFVLVTYFIALLISLLAGIILAALKSNPVFLGIPMPLLPMMKPILAFLFGNQRK